MPPIRPERTTASGGRRHPRLPALCLAVLLAPGPAAAHQLKVFAYAEDGRIHGSAYFAGGIAASDARVRIETGSGELVTELRSDAEGNFSHTTRSARDHQILVDTGDGHVARWQVSASELAGAPVEPAAAEPAPGAGATRSGDDRAELARLVEAAVARQIGPLRAEIHAYAQRVRLGDLLGGLGFIFGLAGAVLWWRSRRQGSGQ